MTNLHLQMENNEDYHLKGKFVYLKKIEDYLKQIFEFLPESRLYY